MAGIQWTRLFLKRHPDLTLRTPEPTSISRLQGFRESEINVFFKNLEELTSKHHYSASKIYNVDETAISTVVEPPKVLAKTGSRRVGLVSSAERGQHTTAVMCCNAVGGFIPPQLIFARKRMHARLETGAPPGTMFSVSDNGWATRETFGEWMRHFIRETGARKEVRTLLLMDNHSSHLTLEAVNMAREAGVDILTFPPHTSHRLQPLDVSVMGPLKTRYREEVACWMRAHPAMRVTQFEVSGLFGGAYLKTMSGEKAVSGFKAAGIVPLNREVFTEEDFLAVKYVLADRLHACEDASAASGAAGPSATTEEPESDSAPADGTEPAVDAASAADAELRKVLLIPRPSPKEVKRKTRAQRSTVLTSSPMKRELEVRAQLNAQKKPKLARRRASHQTTAKGDRQPAASSSASAEDVLPLADECLLCGEGVVGVGEVWLQCGKCSKWCHEACSAGCSSDGRYFCDFCDSS